MKKVEVVAAAIVNDKSILITQRSKGEFAGLWEFPGGKIELGESHEEALIREIQEELYFKINPTAYLTTVEYQYPSFHLTMHVYICEVKSGTPSLTEHSALKWINYNELDGIKWLAADVEVVSALKSYLDTMLQGNSNINHL